ncbi:hypothetical protein [Paenibacillus lutrae]|uniref:Uncharacterized protein n=1 Tax=Paenibacillus lutrae TaxID=2078573 RepID=A0A7X3JYS8_9BACL|nr:hypothetical protein [Paenibacillus lutrae]MVO99317.1 hypothetical protein [Paenibacillus lutrae]
MTALLFIGGFIIIGFKFANMVSKPNYNHRSKRKSGYSSHTDSSGYYGGDGGSDCSSSSGGSDCSGGGDGGGGGGGD